MTTDNQCLPQDQRDSEAIYQGRYIGDLRKKGIWLDCNDQKLGAERWAATADHVWHDPTVIGAHYEYRKLVVVARPAPETLPEVPHGWQLVPVEPTQAMVKAAIAKREDYADISSGRKSYPELETKQAYRAMLSTVAAPEALGATKGELSDAEILDIVHRAPALDTAEAEWLFVARAILAAAKGEQV